MSNTIIGRAAFGPTTDAAQPITSVTTMLANVNADRVAQLEAENANWRALVERMEAAANNLIAAARPFTSQDAALAVAWSQMRGAMPARLSGS